MKKIYSILLLAALCLCGNMRADELGPLYDGTNAKGEYVPLEGGYADAYQRVQVIYPKADLEAMAGKQITKMTFYIKTKAAAAWGATIEVALAETSQNNFDAANTYIDAEFTTVYSGTDLSGTGDVMEVLFSQGFDYSGDNNLLFELRITGKGAYKKTVFFAKGGYDNYMSLYKYNTSSYASITSGNRANVIPKTLFTYEAGAAVTCEKPTGLKEIEVAAKTATLAWDKVADANWQYICLPAAAELNWENATTTTDTFAVVNGLTPETNYKFYVRRYCSAEDQSKEVSVAFQTEKSCFAPTSLNVAENDVTTTTAKVTWGASGKGETSWQYTFEEWSDEVPDWTNALTTTETEVTLTDLTPKTAYQIWVRSYCADDDQSAAITEYFTTKVDCSAAVLPYEDDFSMGIDCWTMTNCHASTGVYEDYYGTTTFRFFYTTTPPQYLISPEFVASAKQVQVEFDYYAYSSSYEESFKVGYSTTDKDVASFTWGDEIKTKNVSSSNPDKFSEIFPAGVKFVAIQHTSNNQYYLFIDNFKASEYEAPTCAAPTALTVSEVADKTAKATWTSEAEKFALELKAEGGEWTAVDAVITTPSFELTNLNEHTTYQVRVKAICGEELESEWVESEAFTTSCSVKEFGYEETFAAELDACWDNSTFHGNQWTPTTDDEQDYFLRYKTSDNAFGKAELVSPAIALPNEGEPVLLFYWMNTGVPGVTLKIWDGETESVLSEDLDAELNEVTGEADDRNWQIKKANLSEFLGKTVAFKLHADGNAKNKYAFFDNFKVCQKPYSLLVPTNVQAVATEDGAVITWTAAWDEPAWDLQYGPKDANKTVVPGIAEKTYTITGLSEGEYELQVRAAFAAEPSAWTEVVTFEVAHEATGIDNTAAKATATKRIVNGQLIIERNGEQYNAQGVSVK